MPTINAIYTDGACSGNPGPGGWGTRIEFADGQVQELGGQNKATTNNRMEMQAAISALEFLSETDIDGGQVTLHTDSEYLKNGITKWIKGWKRKGWKTSTGKAVLNQDLWQQLDQLTETLSAHDWSIDWRYVRGHAGDPGNERCDEIARAFSHGQPIGLKEYKAARKNTQKIARTPENTTKKVDHYKDLSLNTLEISTVTTEEPSGNPALESYEHDSQEGQQAMASSADSKANIKNGSSEETSRIERLKNTLETLQVTDELAKQGYLITSAELADLMDVNASAVTSRGDYWAWRNWTVSRIRREGNQILWQLERIDE
ncbi:MAG: ribonuclease HI [Phormidesmis sp. RL_2_1]|nr:ribonuclease HI [Phormidesmis sp. RL_2_1]